jgi:hypothetical protein
MSTLPYKVSSIAILPIGVARLIYVWIITASYEAWCKEVQEALVSINMPLEEWRKSWAFDFRAEFNAGTTANDVAMKANSVLSLSVRPPHVHWLRVAPTPVVPLSASEQPSG